MTGITEAARAEHAAEHSRKQAESAWRAAWWETTMALSAVPKGAPAKEALRQARVILGHSERYLAQRRLLGRRLARYSLPELRGLPPRLALLYILQADADPGRIHEALRLAAENGWSLRDLARELGSQPASWQREGERAEPGSGPAARTEAGAVIAALEQLRKAVDAFTEAAGRADEGEIAEMARRAAALEPSVKWLASLEWSRKEPAA